MAQHSKHGAPTPEKVVVNGVEYPYVTVTRGMSGYFAVMVWWNAEDGGFSEPWDTHQHRRGSYELAAADGREWAADEKARFVEGRDG